MSDTPRVDEWKRSNKCANWPEVGISPFSFARELEREVNVLTGDLSASLREVAKLESERAALQARVTSLQSLLDQRWEMMRELEVACETKDVEKAVKYVKGLKARVKRLEDALEIGVGLNRARELMGDNHVGEPNEMVAATKEVPCPDCYGGHFRPCNICGDSGMALLRVETEEPKP